MKNREELAKEVEATYRRNRKAFLAKARKAAGNSEDAEDVVHDVIVRVLDNLNVLDMVSNLSSWIFVGIRNRAVDLWRRRELGRKTGETDIACDTLAEIAVAIGLGPADLLAQSEIEDALNDAITALPVEQRQVLEAQVWGGCTFRELSERSGIPMNTLMTRKRQTVRKLSHALRDWIMDE
jgi:RNA polymerase sigma factor (sigma-70 family)